MNHGIYLAAVNAIRPSSDPRRLAGLLRDLNSALKQQMFYWGLDVVHPSGNLLIAQGFVKTRSAGLQGTSCYGRDWQGGRLELHGSCVGWYAPQRSFIFVRPHGRCFLWSGEEAPVPGHWPLAMLEAPGPSALRQHALPFLEWWLESERWLSGKLGDAYRTSCYRGFKKLPRARPWLAPAPAGRWLSGFITDPQALERAKRFRA